MGRGWAAAGGSRLAGSVAGLIQDSLSTGVVGIGGLAKSVVGFLATGVLIGPHALALIHDLEAVQRLAEIGVILRLGLLGTLGCRRGHWRSGLRRFGTRDEDLAQVRQLRVLLRRPLTVVDEDNVVPAAAAPKVAHEGLERARAALDAHDSRERASSGAAPKTTTQNVAVAARLTRR